MSFSKSAVRVPMNFIHCDVMTGRVLNCRVSAVLKNSMILCSGFAKVMRTVFDLFLVTDWS